MKSTTNIRIGFLLTCLVLAGATVGAFGQEILLPASQDNTLYEHVNGSLSNGSGDHLFAGTSASGTIRRGVISFDLTGIPQDASILEASLHMHMSRTISGTTTVSLHRLLASWGEGSSHAAANEGAGATSEQNDATWIHRFFDPEAWTNEGGDFNGSASASAEIGSIGAYTWVSTPSVVADVTHWLEFPEENFGWIMIGAEEASGTAKRFDSRSNPIVENQPQLLVKFEVTTNATTDEIPGTGTLESAWPNPFTASTRIGFFLPGLRHASLEIFDVTGRRVATLVDEWAGPGRNEAVFEAGALPGGVYISRLVLRPAAGDSRVMTGTVILAR